MKKNLFIPIILLLLTIATVYIYQLRKGDLLERKIIQWINTKCDSTSPDPCIINMSDLTNFKWDKMYAFRAGSISKELNGRFSAVKGDDMFSRKIIFVKDNKIILFQRMKTDLEKIVNGGVYFDIPSRMNYEEYTQESAIFSVKRIEGKKSYFELTRIMIKT